MKRIWYHLVKIYIRTGLHFYFKEIKVIGKENIPKKGALLFVSNHKNALIDPLLIATTTTRNIHFLTRASAFKIKFVRWILSTVNMLPIYRLRDGKETLAKNNEIFQKCYNILNKKRSLLIFPEGTHDIRRWVRPLSKGFTRITFGALAQNEELDLTIVPVGLNYSKADEYAECVAIYYGKPIAVNQYYNQDNINESTLELKTIVHEKMKGLTTHIDDIENSDKILKKLGNANFLDPTMTNKMLANLNENASPINDILPKKPSFVWRLLKLVVGVNSIIPLFIYKLIEPNIQEAEFVSTTKFAIGITAFPLFYGLQALLVYHFFGITVGCLYLILSTMLLYILTKTKTSK